MKALVLLTVVAMCFAQASQAQAPSWNAPGGASSLPKQPSGAVNRIEASATARTVGAPPRDRDCKSQITRPETAYETQFTKWFTDGTEDHGQILNQVAGVTRVVQGDLNDVQVRIEQLRCEEQNIKAKLDFIIRALVPQ